MKTSPSFVVYTIITPILQKKLWHRKVKSFA